MESKKDEQLNSILEIVGFIKDNAASKQDLTDLNKRIDELPTKEDFSELQTAVDSYAKRANDYFEEMLALSHKLDRHEKWIQQLAQKLDIKLEY